jgi:UDP-N-acetylglucosamine 1-carboxyvinyltransferase
LSVRGGGIVRDSVWRERFGYLETLSKMGLDYKVGNGCAHIYKSNLHSAAVTAPDLRGGMAVLMSALFADGVSEILSPEIILRGYDHLIEKLSSLGADVKLIKM